MGAFGNHILGKVTMLPHRYRRTHRYTDGWTDVQTTCHSNSRNRSKALLPKVWLSLLLYPGLGLALYTDAVSGHSIYVQWRS